jgi:hypothetical protein
MSLGCCGAWWVSYFFFWGGPLTRLCCGTFTSLFRFSVSFDTVVRFLSLDYESLCWTVGTDAR